MLRNGSDGAQRNDNAADRAVLDAAESLAMPRLSAGALAGLGRDELLGVLGDIERLANRLAGYRAEVLGALEVLNQSGVAPDAAPCLSLRNAAGVSERDARQMVRSAEKAREHSTVLEALSEGDINVAQAETLCDARVPDPVRAELITAAAGEDTDATRRRVRRAEAEHSAETSLERFERQRAARGAGWRRDHEGMLRLWAKFDPASGAQIEAALEALRREYWSDDRSVRNGRRTPAQRDADVLAYALAGLTYTDADAAAVARLHSRARSRRHADDGPTPSRRTTPRNSPPKQTAARPRDSAREQTAAGRNRAGRSASDGTLPDRVASHTTPPDHLPSDVTQPDRALSDGTLPDGFASDTGQPINATRGTDAANNEALLADDEGLALGRKLPPAQVSVLIGLDALRGQTDEMGLTDAGVELPPEIVRRMACDAEIIPIILGGSGGPADAGRSRRTVSLRLRRLLVARDRHCRWPGCHEPPSRCDAHHIWHWIDGGPTNLDNLVLLCHRHHHHLHQHGYRMVPQPDGTWAAVQESGRGPTPTPRRGKRRARAP